MQTQDRLETKVPTCIQVPLHGLGLPTPLSALVRAAELQPFTAEKPARFFGLILLKDVQKRLKKN